MKNVLIFLIGSLFFLLFINFVSAETNAGSMVVSTDVQSETISIDVNSSIDFGTIAKGYNSTRQTIKITNKGNVGINVVPRLDSSYNGGIFNYLYFQRILSDPLKQIGNFSISIDKPNTLGGTENETMYIWLNLENYIGNINSAMNDHNTNVIFWATKV
jgi:hypothetical protein